LPVPKRFLSNLVFLLALNFLVKPIYIFGIDRTVQVRVPLGDYGLYFALYNFSLLFYILLDWGLSQHNSRTVARDPSLLPASFPHFITAKFILAMVYLSLVLVLAIANGYSARALHWLVFLSLNQIFISFIFYCRSSVAALGLFRLDALLSVLDRFLAIFFCGFMLLDPRFSPFKIDYFLLGQCAAYALAALASGIATMCLAGFPRPSWNGTAIIGIMKQSAPVALLILLATIATRIDAIMLERMLTADGHIQTECYAAAFRLLDVLGIVGLLFAGQLLPLFSAKLDEPNDLKQLTRTAFSLLATFSLASALLVFFNREPIIALLYGNKYPLHETALLMGLLLFTLLPLASHYVFNTLLFAKGEFKWLGFTAALGIALNIALNAWLIPSHKALGATAATLATQGLLGISYLLLAWRKLDITLGKRFAIRFAAFALVSALALWGIHTSGFSPIWQIATSGVVLALLAVALGLIKTSSVPFESG
jgi:O-antigen/teichoic acid export membrane protein